MIKRDAQDLGSILKEIMEENTLLRSRIAEHRVLRAWREILGKGVNKYTSKFIFQTWCTVCSSKFICFTCRTNDEQKKPD